MQQCDQGVDWTQICDWGRRFYPIGHVDVAFNYFVNQQIISVQNHQNFTESSVAVYLYAFF